ncbi:hypothetical protein ACTL6U_09160 [Rhodovibrionaceae bacterium A322]
MADDQDGDMKSLAVRDLVSLLYATKARLENEHFFCSLSYDDQAWALDLLDEMVPQIMELENNHSFALLDQVNLKEAELAAGLDKVRHYLDHVGNQPEFFKATESFLALLNDLLAPVRGPCLP